METEPEIIERYVRTGKARLVYRHLLQLGEATVALAEASECAGEQNRFWEMRELIYRRQGDLYTATTFEAIRPLVAELGLDDGKFQQCFDARQFEQQVAADYAAAQREGIRSRPVTDINGTRIIGAQPIARFREAIDAAAP